MSTSNRFFQKPPQRRIASAPLPALPAHVAFNHSMIAQATRVPRLAGLTGNARVGIWAPPSVGRRR
jgi:hypothetical protein